jgi:hypothetical protein
MKAILMKQVDEIQVDEIQVDEFLTRISYPVNQKKHKSVKVRKLAARSDKTLTANSYRLSASLVNVIHLLT